MTIYLLEIATYGSLLFLVALILERRAFNMTQKRAEKFKVDLHTATISESEADWIAELLREALQRRETRVPSTRLAQEK
jgi:hypothetical protein